MQAEYTHYPNPRPQPQTPIPPPKPQTRLSFPDFHTPNKSTLFSDADTISFTSSDILEHHNPHLNELFNSPNPIPLQLQLNFDPSALNYKAQPQSDKYKTELCKFYNMHGHCKWGSSCFFAHGKSELRSKVAINHYYKTKICKHYHRVGYCPYGSRCQYFHFKAFEMYQELLDSFVKKLMMRVAEDSCRIDGVIDKGERVQKRLAVFERFCKGDGQKSVQERFLDDEF